MIHTTLPDQGRPEQISMICTHPQGVPRTRLSVTPLLSGRTLWRHIHRHKSMRAARRATRCRGSQGTLLAPRSHSRSAVGRPRRIRLVSSPWKSSPWRRRLLNLDAGGGGGRIYYVATSRWTCYRSHRRCFGSSSDIRCRPFLCPKSPKNPANST